MTDFAGDHSTICQLSSQTQQQQQQRASSENQALDNCEGNIVQEPQNEMAAQVDSQTEMENTENEVLLPCDFTSTYAF